MLIIGQLPHALPPAQQEAGAQPAPPASPPRPSRPSRREMAKRAAATGSVVAGVGALALFMEAIIDQPTNSQSSEIPLKFLGAGTLLAAGIGLLNLSRRLEDGAPDSAAVVDDAAAENVTPPSTPQQAEIGQETPFDIENPAQQSPA